MPPESFDILFEDGPCLVLMKPGGLLTQAPPSIDSLEKKVKAFIKVRDRKPGNVYLGMPHRLDRPVSGAIVVARNIRATRRLAEQFQNRTVGKTYLAAVQGELEAPEGTWTDHLRKVPGESRAECVEPGHPEGRSAVLHYRVLGSTPSITVLEIQLETGRTHQIRVQLASRGLPILGDHQYGASQTFGPEVIDPRDKWIALHSQKLSFRHPKSRERISVEAPLPAYWKALDWSG